jgi:HK97 family phage portal protein
MSFYSWLVKTGLRGLRRKAEATGRSGLLNASWEVVLGNRSFSDAEEIWGTMNDAERQAVYKAHAVIYACVRLICTSFHAAPLQIGYEDANGFKAVENHPVLDVLYRPNAMMSYAELMEYHVGHLLLTGKSYIWEFRDPQGNVAELWPIPSHWVKVVPLGRIEGKAAQRQREERRFISHFEVQAPGAQRAIPVSTQDMTYVRFMDPTNYLEGVGPLQACYKDYKLDIERANYLVEMMNNLKVPGMIVKQQEEFTKEEREELKAVLENVVGRGKRGSPLFLWGEGAGVEMVAPLKDLDWPGLSSTSESHICAAFGVPPLMIHLRMAQENSPLSSPNLEAAEQVFFRTTMSSLWLHNGYALTRGLILNEGYDERLELRHDLSDVKALQEDMTKTATVVATSVNGGVMQINEGRERLGLTPDPKLEGVYLIPMGMTHYKPGQEELLGGKDESQAWDEGQEENGDENGNGGSGGGDGAGDGERVSDAVEQRGDSGESE